MRKRNWLSGGMLAALATAIPSVAFAQVGIEGQTGNRDRPLPVPDYRAPAPQPFDQASPVLPPAPGRAATAESFVAREIRVVGATLLTPDELAAHTQRYVNRPIQAADLLALRDEITSAYIEKGYLNSGAVIPDQDVSDGVVDINVIEGRLTGVEVRGLERLRQSYVTSRVEAEGVLQRDDLQASFERLASDPNIAQIDARLGPGAQPGEAILTLDVREAERWTGEVELASDRSPSVGGERAILRSALRNGLGIGDRTSVELGATEGLIDAALSFYTPLNRHDLGLTLEANASEAEVVEEPLNDLDIISESYTLRASLTQPLMRGDGKSLVAGLGVQFSHAQTELLGEPFSFSPGSVDGETELTTLNATLDFVAQSPRQVLAVRSTLSYGIDAIDQIDGAPDALEENFSYLAVQAQFARAMTESGQQFLARADLQVSDTSLFSLEQFSFGGMDSVRGYRKNQVLADNGVVASLEYRVPLRDLMPGQAQQTGQPRWLGAVFIDAGYGWNTDLPDPDIHELVGAGVSLTWRPTDRISAQLYYAAEIEETPDPVDETVQDYGVGFRITARLW